jgi:hypothetical protein
MYTMFVTDRDKLNAQYTSIRLKGHLTEEH